MNKRISFGMPLAEVIQKLGNPNKEYFKDSQLFLNYLELGLDILFEHSHNSVQKFILHTNQTKMPDFCFYDRCAFELVLPKHTDDSQNHLFSEEIRLNQNDNSLCVSKIQDDPNRNEGSDDDEECLSEIKTPPRKEESIIDPSKASVISIGELENHLKKVMNVNQPVENEPKEIQQQQILENIEFEEKDKSILDQSLAP